MRETADRFFSFSVVPYCCAAKMGRLSLLLVIALALLPIVISLADAGSLQPAGMEDVTEYVEIDASAHPAWEVEIKKLLALPQAQWDQYGGVKARTLILAQLQLPHSRRDKAWLLVQSADTAPTNAEACEALKQAEAEAVTSGGIADIKVDMKKVPDCSRSLVSVASSSTSAKTKLKALKAKASASARTRGFTPTWEQRPHVRPLRFTPRATRPSTGIALTRFKQQARSQSADEWSFAKKANKLLSCLPASCSKSQYTELENLGNEANAIAENNESLDKLNPNRRAFVFYLIGELAYAWGWDFPYVCKNMKHALSMEPTHQGIIHAINAYVKIVC